MVSEFEEKSKNSKWWPLVTLLIIIISSVLFLLIGDSNEELRYGTTSVETTGCVIMQDRGNYKDSINIVFLATEYENINKFREDSNKLMSSFLNTVPYNKYPDRFNFFRIEESKDYGCKYDGAIVCKPALAQREASKCPGGDYTVVLSDYSSVKNLFSHLRSSSWFNLNSLNVADDPLVFPHEFAHSFADFADEYVYGGKINWKAPNCDSDYEYCSKFSSVEGYECHLGCVNNENSRSVYVGIMRDYWVKEGKRYGLYNEWVLENLILDRTKEVEEKVDEEPVDVYLVNGNCDSEGNCVIDNIDLDSILGYPTKSPSKDSSVSLNYGEYNYKIPSRSLLFTESNKSNNVIFTEIEFTIAIPVDIEENNIEIIDNEGNIQDSYIIPAKSFSSIFSKEVKIPSVN
tara:strand:+ start:690 stop:1898 length:1209 start_codon:yes stop_codon:yes gene_type:complete